MQKLVATLLAYRRRQTTLADITFQSTIDVDRSPTPIKSVLSVALQGSDVAAVVPFQVEETLSVAASDRDPATIVDTMIGALSAPWESDGCFIHRHSFAGARVEPRAPGLETRITLRWKGEASWRG